MTITRAYDRLTGARAPVINLRPLLGAWVNYDQQTTGILGLRISDQHGQLAVRVAGAWEPNPMDWGVAPGAAFSAGVTSAEATGFTAQYRIPDVMDVLLAVYLNKRLLVVDAYTTFTDNSGRANYFQRDHLYLR
jgi:hypothetical protein